MNDNNLNSVKDQIPVAMKDQIGVALTKKWLDPVNETAKIVRTSLLLFLVVALYLLIIVGTTTDLMLLRGEIVALPLMEVGVPVVAFYIVAPLIFLLLHSNLLLRLCQLTETVSNSKGLKDEDSSLVFPLDFARLLLDGKIHWALYAVVVTQIAILPIVVLLALQMNFLAYQNSFITVWHQLIVTTDLVLLFLSVCFVIGTRAEKEVDRNYVLKMLFQRSGKFFLVNLVLISAGLVLILVWTIAVVPNSWQETMGIFVAMFVGLFFLLRLYVSKRLRNKQDNELNKFFLPTKCIVLYGVILLYFLGIVTISADGLQERFIQRQLSAWVFADWWWKEDPIISYRPARRFLNVSEQLIVLKEIPPEIVGESIIEEAKFKGEEAKPDPLCKYIGELDLSGRQLNYALFYGSQFRCVKLEFAELLGTNLVSAKLHGVDLVGAKLHGANLSNAELYDANLSLAELHDADLGSAKLRGAALFNAELHGANLFGADLYRAKLHGADLSEAKLSIANLFGAELHGADLSEAELRNTDLQLAELHDADLRFAELYGANLSEAKLHGADLSNAKLYDADLTETELHGANLSRAELHGAYLSETRLHGVDLSDAELYGADLSDAELYGADLFGAKLHGADLSDAELHGADLGQAELYGADLRWTKLYGADLGAVILKNTDLSNARWDKPEDWDNIISSILDSLKKRGLADDEINWALSRIEEISSRISSTQFGFVPPTIPIATDCVFHSGQGPFKGWPEPGKGCDLTFISSLADLACQNQWTAKSIVERAIYRSARYRKKDIDLITALFNKDCLSLDSYREELSDELKELNQ